MLVAPLRLVLDMARQVHFAIFGDDLGLPVSQDLGVEMPPFRRQLGVAKADRNTRLARPVEQRLRRRVRHRGFEPCINVGLILHHPAGEEGGERQLGKHHQIAFRRDGLIEQRHHARHHRLTTIGFLDRPHLGAADDYFAHRVLLFRHPI